jgi:hypothetical protein
MTASDSKLVKSGGLTFVIAGVLFFAANLIVITLPHPPAVEAEFFEWLSGNSLILMLQNELLMFAALFLVPSAIALYVLQKERASRSAITGTGLMMAAIPVLFMLVIVAGRLVYPVYGIQLSFDALKLMLSVYHGGMHAVFIILAVSIVLISLAMRSLGFPKLHRYLGLINGVSLIAGSYPWLTGFAFNLIVIMVLSSWLVLTGTSILQWIREPEQGPLPSESSQIS